MGRGAVETPGRGGVIGPALVAIGAIVVVDAACAVARSRSSFAPTTAMAFAIVSLGIGGVLLAPLIASRLRAADYAGEHWWTCAALGGVDAAIVALATHTEALRTWGSGQAGAVIAATVIVAAAVRAAARRRPRLLLGLAAGIAAAAGLVWALLPWRLYDRTHLATGAVIAYVLAAVLRGKVAPSGRWTYAMVGAVLVAAMLAEPMVGDSSVRGLLHLESVQARATARIVLDAVDLDGDGVANVLGEHDCAPLDSRIFPAASEHADDDRDSNCEGGDGLAVRAPPAARSPNDGPHPDVLLFSVDALRWDVADMLARTRRALGPHARFDLAVSPSARTADSLAAVMAGRPLRQLRASR